MKKKIIFLLIFVACLAIVPPVVFYLNHQKSASTKNSYQKFNQKIKEKILSYTPDKIIPENLNNLLTQINDPKASDQDKYKALTVLEFYFSAKYTDTYDPSIPKFVEQTMGTFAKENFPKYYIPGDFIIPCSDPVCGNKIDKNGQAIIDSISENKNIDTPNKDTILYNLKTALYIPDKDLQNKEAGINLTIEQLAQLNNKEASDSANSLKTYFYNRYHIKL